MRKKVVADPATTKFLLFEGYFVIQSNISNNFFKNS